MPLIPKVTKTYLGIDPGASGGLALVQDGSIVEWAVNPSSDHDLFNQLLWYNDNYKITYCHIEKVHSMPGEGHVGAFSFGEGYGKLQMALTASGIAYEKITPRTWQKGLSIKAKNKDESKPQFKERLRQHAHQIFPKVGLWSEPRTLGKQRAVCDAMLIAEYCRRKQEGLL